MDDLEKELRNILGTVIDLPPMTDAEAIRFINELKAMPNPSAQRTEWIRELDEAWHRAAAPDMMRR